MNGTENKAREPGYQDTSQSQEGARVWAQPVGVERPRRSPARAAVLSLMPGLGQIYVGYYQQGFLNMAIVATCITILASDGLHDLKPFFGLGLAFFWLFNMIDANRRAHHFNRAMAGMEAEIPPADFKLPKSGGSMFGGVVLIALGVLFILDLNFDIPLDWLENWWPMVLVLAGARLVWQARRKSD